MSYSIQVLKMGEADVPGPEVYWMSHWGEWETLFFYMVVIRGNGVTAIVNTGPPSDLSVLNHAWKQFAGERCQLKRLDEERPERALGKIGVRPEEVDYVLLTPLQAYATANLSLFPKAKICFSRRGWIEDIVARLPYVHVPRSLCISDDVLKYLIFEAWDRVRLLEDDDEICPGISAWWAGTHHRSSVVYSVASNRGTVMIGDCAFKYGNLTGPPLGIGESLAEGDKAYRRIQSQAADFIPLYDPEVLHKYPNGIVR
jgi:glyoxylase-like metal-dependent hydrolase (beta-lactamase superfamily II)